MYEGNSFLAVIPARGGSKGLPNKNIANCAGRPLICWTIEAAIKANYIDHVFVSTDSISIAEVSKQAGVCVPILRPENLADDNSSLIDAIEHAWKVCTDKNGKRYDYVIVLQPTSPLRTSTHICEAIHAFFRKKTTNRDTLASVYPVNQKYGWLMSQEVGSDYLEFCMEVSRDNPQRQRLGKYYLPNGAIFIARGDELGLGFYAKNTIPYIMNIDESVDVDTKEDLDLASQMLEK